METNKNLKEAFAGESQANRKYIAFSRKAEKEGLKQIARLFRATAEAETVHALKHFEVMGGIKSTKDNVQAAIEGETFEFTKMYPAMIEQAIKDKNEAAKTTFKLANEVEKIHARHFSDALEAVKAGKDLDKSEIYICEVCGNTIIGNMPGKCSVCGAGKNSFILIK